MLPRPWHDSHPTFLALSPGAFSRVCVAVLKSRVMGSWHCEHVSEPTNSAPGMFGGAIKVRLTVAQEIAAAVAVKTPATTSSLRRLTFFFVESPSCVGEPYNEGLKDVSWFSEGCCMCPRLSFWSGKTDGS